MRWTYGPLHRPLLDFIQQIQLFLVTLCLVGHTGANKKKRVPSFRDCNDIDWLMSSYVLDDATATV